MSESRPKSKSLPPEIILCILKQVNKEDVIICALVCKVWLPFTQTLLYTEVCIKNFSQLERFHWTIKQNSYLGMKVKCLELQICRGDYPPYCREEALDMLSDLFSTCLPNLTSIQDYACLVIHTQLKQALMNSQLKYLKRLEIPSHKIRLEEEEAENYETCVLLMKDRLENICISDYCIGLFKPTLDPQLLFDRLYSKLGQFNRLKKIEIIRNRNDGILLLEDIVESCPTLEEIIWKALPCSVVPTNCIARKFKPRVNIKVFRTDNDDEFVLDEKLLIYIMHKFPKLVDCNAFFEHDATISPPVSEQFIHYLTKMDSFRVWNIPVKHRAIIDAIGNFWITNSTLGRESVGVCFSEDMSLGQTELSASQDHTYIEYSRLSNYRDWEHAEFLKKNGRFLKGVRYSTCIASEFFTAQVMGVPDDLIAHTFAYCPWLQDLSFDDCYLKDFGTFPTEKRSLNELSFSRCKIQKGVLESFSTTLSEVKHLKLFHFEDIKMPQTKIEMITLELGRNTSLLYVKITNTIDRSSCYYKLHAYKTQVLPSTETDFMKSYPYDRVEICCGSSPVVKCESSTADRLTLY